jgi:hypothetical protein
MSEPQQTTPKGPRRSGRRPKPVPSGDESAITQPSDFDSSAAPSAAEYAPEGVSPATNKKKHKKKTQSAKKAAPELGLDESVRPETNRNAYSSNVPNKAKATPIKMQQAYAGPTFHHSPAPSALPIPSFYSKSVPNVSTTRPPEAANDSGAPQDGGKDVNTHLSPPKPEHVVQREPESTPLDFLFEAAKKAKGTPRGESPDTRSVSMRGYDSPYSRSPAPREGDPVFPFELESGRNTPGGIAPSFATPYKDRMDALRSTSSSVGAASDLSEAEARAKSDALKKFMNLTPQPISVSADTPDPNNPFHARAPQPRNLYQPVPQHRHRSGPSTPVSSLQNGAGPAQYFPNMPQAPYGAQNYASPMHRPASSHLRHMYHPSVESSPVELPFGGANDPSFISTARMPSSQHETPRQMREQFEATQGPFEQMPQHKSKPSAQELENQLRSILKLGA